MVACLSWLACAGQSPDNAAPAQAAPAAPVENAPAPPAQAAPVAPVTPSGLLQPALDTVQQTLTGVNLEKWKRGNIREEAGDNIGKILKDLKETLPPLMSVADGAPGSLSQLLPVARNVAAVYDVLLRVVEAARVSGSPEQISALQESLISLGNARLALDAQMQDAAVAMEKQVTELRVTVQRQEDFKCPVAPVPVAKPCVPATPHRAVRRRPKPTEKAPEKTGPIGKAPEKTTPGGKAPEKKSNAPEKKTTPDKKNPPASTTSTTPKTGL